MYFFAYQSEVPAGMGFRHFGPAHIVWLVCIIGGIVLLSLYFARQNEKTRRRMSVALAWCTFGLLAVEYLILILTGHFTRYHLPLHLCEMTPFLCLIFLYTRWDWVGQTLYALCTAGALSAILFPDWNMYPQWNYMNITSFLLHAGLVMFPVWQVIAGEIRPRLRAMWKPWVFLAVVIPPIYYLNLELGTNYYFLLGDAPGSPLTVLYDIFGKVGYLPSYAVLALILMTVEDLPWRNKCKTSGESDLEEL